VARFVIHEDALDDIDTEPVMRDIADAIAADARRLAPKGRTGRLAAGIRVAEVSDSHAIIESTARNPRSSEEHAEYPYWVEKGTRRSKARPYMRPAAYKYRAL
jgi:hypothetical protein